MGSIMRKRGYRVDKSLGIVEEGLMAAPLPSLIDNAGTKGWKLMSR